MAVARVRPAHARDRETLDEESRPAPGLVWPPPADDVDDIEVLDLWRAGRVAAPPLEAHGIESPSTGTRPDDSPLNDTRQPDAPVTAVASAPHQGTTWEPADWRHEHAGEEAPASAWSVGDEDVAGSAVIVERVSPPCEEPHPRATAAALLAAAVILAVATAADLGDDGVRKAREGRLGRVDAVGTAGTIEPPDAVKAPAASSAPPPPPATSAEASSGVSARRLFDDQAALEAARRGALLRRPDAPSLSSYQRAMRLQDQAWAMIRAGRPQAAHVATRTALDLYNIIGSSPPASPPPSRDTAANAAAFPTPPTRAPIVTATATPIEQVQVALRRYRSAYNRLDADAAHAVWPGADVHALGRAFSGLESQVLVFDSCDVTVESAHARAACRGRATYVRREGARLPRTVSRVWAFRLRAADDGWVIAAVDTR